MKNKLFAVLLCMVLAVTTGCQNDDVMVLTPDGDAVIRDDGSSAEEASTEKKSEEKKETKEKNSSNKSKKDLIHIGFAQVGAESGWRMAQTQSMKSTFTEENGYNLDFVDCNNDPATQKEAIQKFIQDKVQYIVLDPIVEKGYDDVLQEAKDADIPVIVVDRNIKADKSLYKYWVGSDFMKEGEDAAKWLETYLQKQGRDNKKINILTILGSDGASATIGRTDGFEKIAKSHSNWKLLDKQTGDFTEDGGNAVMKVFLKKYSDIDVVVCQNDDEAFGAIDAIKAAGKTCGPNGDIIIISFDATKNGFQSMIDGDINVDVECNPLEGPLVAELIEKMIAGEEGEEIQYVEEGVFSAEEAADIIDDRAY